MRKTKKKKRKWIRIFLIKVLWHIQISRPRSLQSKMIYWVGIFFSEFCPFFLFVCFIVNFINDFILNSGGRSFLFKQISSSCRMSTDGYDYALEIAIIIWCYLMFSQGARTCGKETWAIIKIRKDFVSYFYRLWNTPRPFKPETENHQFRCFLKFQKVQSLFGGTGKQRNLSSPAGTYSVPN